jgi:amino acid transporter
MPAAIGALSVAFVGSLATALGWRIETLADHSTSTLLALGVIAITAWVNVVGVIWGGRVQALTTLIKGAFLALLAVLPFALAFVGFAEIGAASYRSTLEAVQPTVATQFAAALLAVMWAYNGWFAVTPVAEEVRNPHRNIPLAFFAGIGLVTLLYVGATVAYHAVLTMGEMAAAGEAVPQTMIRKLMAPTSEGLAGLGVGAISAVIMCSIFGTINANTMNGPRVTFAMGRDGVFLRPLAWVHSDYRTPVIAIAVQAAMSTLLLVASAVLVQTVDGLQDRNVFGMLTDYVVFSVGIFLALAVLAVIVLRIKHPEWRRPYRALGYPVVPLLYVAFYGWFLREVYMAKPFEALVGLGLIALGLPVYLARKVWAQRAEGPIAPSA